MSTLDAAEMAERSAQLVAKLDVALQAAQAAAVAQMADRERPEAPGAAEGVL